MKKDIPISILLSILLCLLNSTEVFSWDNKVTHRDISEIATENSILGKSNGDYLKQLGFDQGTMQQLTWGANSIPVKKWLSEGAFLEDEDTDNIPITELASELISNRARFNNHFHNPLLTKEQWGTAGLNNYVIIPILFYGTVPFPIYGQSAILWAQDGTRQAGFREGDWSWQKTRANYWSALTATVNADRQAYFARTFRGLGHQMHLLQDMAVPAHVRNNAHPQETILAKMGILKFEPWVAANAGIINVYANNPVKPQVSFDIPQSSLAPVTQLFDTDQYTGANPSSSLTWGLAEYTNANFFSDDTILTAGFPYPAWSSVVENRETDAAGKIKVYLKKTGDGETVNHLAVGKWYYKYLPSGLSSALRLDDACYQDYAAKLIPRAVGYSAALLDYFFRGKIEITLPDSGVYAKVDDPAAGENPAGFGFTQIKLRAENKTDNAEEMTDGAISLVVKYKLAQSDPFQSDEVATSNEVFYIVAPEASGVKSIPRDSSTELVFNLSPALPLYATDVYIQVIYKGKLGAEEGAVAVGFKDISEPTPIDLFSNTDRICINDSWYPAGSHAAVITVDPDEVGDVTYKWDVYAHDQSGIYIKVSSVEKPQQASPADYDVLVPYLIASKFNRPLFILTDYQFSYSTYTSWVKINTDKDTFIEYDTTRIVTGTAIKRQTDHLEGSGKCDGAASCDIDYHPVFFNVRGAKMWWGGGLVYVNDPYPKGSPACVCGSESVCE